jgi:alpha-L-fucosidase
MITTKKLFLFAGAWLAGFTPHLLAEYPGNAFLVTPDKIELEEGKSLVLTAQAGGAQNLFWTIKRDAEDKVVAVDTLTYTFNAGRVVADTDFVLQFKAVYPNNEVKDRNLVVKIKETLPEPVFSLRSPATWNGRDPIEVSPDIANLAAMKAKGVGELKYTWAVTSGTVLKEIAPDRLLLKRAKEGDTLTVRLTLNNGGADYAAKTSIEVTTKAASAKPTQGKETRAAKAPAIRFEPTMESLKQYETPEWYADAKLGIYMHWGPMSIPGVATTWYARWIYEQGCDGNQYHVATYGHPSKFGYKDICKLFKAPKFDQAQADRYVKLYKQVGARYVVPVAVHHDNFDMWDSKYQPRWNSVATAGKDVVGMWKKACDKEKLHLGVASHFARTYRWLQTSHGSDGSGPMAGVPYDGQDPAYADLYGEKWNDTSMWYEQRSDVGPPAFEKNFEDRLRDLMYKYHPDLYYTDGGIPFKQAGLNVLAHFYNANQQWNNGKLQAVATIKLDWVPNVAIQNYEFGYPESVQHYPWQSDKTMGADWYWIRNATDRYMSSGNAIRMLIDTVSKGGNLLLNVPLTPEGELEPTTLTFLTEMGKCLDIIGESIFATRCWMTATDGDSIRFTRSKDNTVLYVINLGWSNDQVGVRTLGSSRIDLTTLTGVSLLGSSEKLTYSQDAGGFTIKVGKAPFESPAYAFKLTFSGQIPKLK